MNTGDTGHYKEEFSSVGGQSISLGNYTQKRHNQYGYKDDFVKHATITPENQSNDLKNGLSETRFHKGFQRRQKEDIKNILAETELKAIAQYQAVKEDRNKVINERRKDHLVNLDARNGYNIITNQSKPVKSDYLIRPATTSIKIIENQGFGSESTFRGKLELRESTGRYFLPLGSGAAAEHRQDVLYREGLLKGKHTGILQADKGDLISYGIEDQFTKSEYMPIPAKSQYGLVEKRVPGKYTPRKVANNPSGNPKVVEKWTTDIDLFNKSSTGGVIANANRRHK